mgnify:CR=1 FL=1
MLSLELLLTLIGCHFICDYVLQNDAIATGKNRLLDPAKFGVNWQYWLTSHAATHGFGVGIITGSFWLGFMEFVLHWLIDAGKCEDLYCLHADQTLHLLCKILIVYLALYIL